MKDKILQDARNLVTVFQGQTFSDPREETAWLDKAISRLMLHHTAQATKELREALISLLSMDELEMGDESILEEDEPNHPVIKARQALRNLSPDQG